MVGEWELKEVEELDWEWKGEGRSRKWMCIGGWSWWKVSSGGGEREEGMRFGWKEEECCGIVGEDFS